MQLRPDFPAYLCNEFQNTEMNFRTRSAVHSLSRIALCPLSCNLSPALSWAATDRSPDDFADLGITALRINPVQKQVSQSPYANAPAKSGITECKIRGLHSYRVDDFTAMDAHFGNTDDLKEPVGEAHKRDIKVLLDQVKHAGYGSGYESRRISDL
jgi:hypothetical protein